MKVHADPDNMLTKTVDEYGRISVGTDLTGKEIEIAILEVKDDENDEDRK